MIPFTINPFDSELEKLVIQYEATGSRVICNPPVLDTDADFIVITKDIEKFRYLAKEEGYVTTASEEYEFAETDFMCFRRGEVNLIVTTSFNFFDRWNLATELATRFNLLNKIDRKDLFSAILTGELARVS